MHSGFDVPTLKCAWECVIGNGRFQIVCIRIWGGAKRGNALLFESQWVPRSCLNAETKFKKKTHKNIYEK